MYPLPCNRAHLTKQWRLLWCYFFEHFDLSGSAPFNRGWESSGKALHRKRVPDIL